jgi:MarR family transcriptional regulator, lower aerobic nicotinate degradation pathway regulator
MSADARMLGKPTHLRGVEAQPFVSEAATSDSISMLKMSMVIKSHTMPPASTPAGPGFLEAQPGHYIRRLQQIAVGIFLEEAAGTGITPVQFAALVAVREHPGIDQRTLAAHIAFDTSTIGGVVDRLERDGLMQRQTSPTDRRARVLNLTPAGQQALDGLLPAVLRTQQRILAPLPTARQREFCELLRMAVEGNNDASRAPKLGD